MTKPNPDCTGQRFGRLLVLGKGGKKPRGNSYIQLWKVQCDCGRLIEIPRNSFESKRQTSCGCKRRLGLVDNNRYPLDISNQRFGDLTAVYLTGKKNNRKPTWLLECDCGTTREMSLSLIRSLQKQGVKLNCGNKNRHPDKYFKYPPTPNPYPREASQLLEKYFYLTKLDFQKIDSQVEDEKVDRLLRACWIIAYRRQEGEEIPELKEKRIINKHLRYCSIDVFWKRKVEKNGGLLYTMDGKTKSIGSAMTDLTLNDYPAIETQGINFLPKNNSQTIRRVRFNRC